jgi:6-phosphogluconolactonase
MSQLLVLPDADAVHAHAARRIATACQCAQDERGVFAWALAGGSTPRATYRRLRDAPIDWQRVRVFWSDERAVPASSPDSNQRMAREALLDAVRLPPDRLHAMNGAASDLDAAARDYEATMLRLLGDPPRVDLALLGLGADAHTASLFPGTPALHETERWVMSNPVPRIGPRITWTPPALRAARQILVLVTGDEKRNALKLALEADFDPARIPIQSVLEKHGDAVVLADRAAAPDASRPTA